MERVRKTFVKSMAQKILKENAISMPPVDIKQIVENLGYIYLEVDTFLDNIDALILEENGITYAAVNKKHHPNRKRFSLAHELGHKTLHHRIEYYRTDITLDNPPGNKKHLTTEKIFESEAHCFAGELLVPLSMLKEEFKKTNNIDELSNIFKVSTQVMGIAISNNMNHLYK